MRQNKQPEVMKRGLFGHGDGGKNGESGLDRTQAGALVSLQDILCHDRLFRVRQGAQIEDHKRLSRTWVNIVADHVSPLKRVGRPVTASWGWPAVKLFRHARPTGA